jgi:hypothetical protein
MKREQELLDNFLKMAEGMDVSPLEIDRFFHEGFYGELTSVEENLETLQIFINNGRKN